MTGNEVTFIGYDRNGYLVWHHPDGRVLSDMFDKDQAANCFNHGGGVPMSAFMKHNGPIKEKP